MPSNSEKGFLWIYHKAKIGQWDSKESSEAIWNSNLKTKSVLSESCWMIASYIILAKEIRCYLLLESSNTAVSDNLSIVWSYVKKILLFYHFFKLESIQSICIKRS